LRLTLEDSKYSPKFVSSVANYTMGKVRLRVLEVGVADNQADNYILILGEYGGNRRLPVVIPPMEAQAIAVQLEKISPAHPLVHDLFFNAVSSFGVEMLEVNITAFKNGIFSSEVILFDGEKEKTFKARTSDAIALALRFRCSIFATSDVMELAGITIEEEPEEEPDTPMHDNKFMGAVDLKNYSNQELERMLDEFVEKEEYEMATAIRDELRKRSGKK